jgi:hypothetical protein
MHNIDHELIKTALIVGSFFASLYVVPRVLYRLQDRVKTSVRRAIGQRR